MLVSPSLDGVLSHDDVTYEGIRRPLDVMRVLDGPSAKGGRKTGSAGARSDVISDEKSYKVLGQYFNDLYGIFMKNLSHFVVGSEVKPVETVKLQAMLQEMIKIKGLMSKVDKSENSPKDSH